MGMHYKKIVSVGLSMVLGASGFAHSSEISPFHYPLHKLISQQEIQEKLQGLQEVLAQDYAGEELCVIAVLKGSLWFATDLLSSLSFPATLQTISCSSYGARGAEAGELSIEGLSQLDITGKHVLIVDDICDSGVTLSRLKEELQKFSPKSMKTAVCLLKNTTRSIGYEPDYHLFGIPDAFVVGYGMDYKEYYRGLADIYELEYSAPTETVE